MTSYIIYIPLVPTPPSVVRRMVELAGLSPGELLYDLGSGDGRVVVAASKDYGANAVGIEIREDLVRESLKKVRKAGLEERVKIIRGDLFNIDVSDADVVTMYLLPCTIKLLKPKLERELKSGARVVTYVYPVLGWDPCEVEVVHGGSTSKRIFLYKQGLSF